jgi:hypothetical protein
LRKRKERWEMKIERKVTKKNAKERQKMTTMRTRVLEGNSTDNKRTNTRKGSASRRIQKKSQ